MTHITEIDEILAAVKYAQNCVAYGRDLESTTDPKERATLIDYHSLFYARGSALVGRDRFDEMVGEFKATGKIAL